MLCAWVVTCQPSLGLLRVSSADWEGACIGSRRREEASLFCVLLSCIFTSVRLNITEVLGKKLSFPSLQYRESHQKVWALYANLSLGANPQFCTHIFLFFLMKVLVLGAGWQFFSRADFTYLFQFHIQWYPVSSLKLPIVRICNLTWKWADSTDQEYIFAGKPAYQHSTRYNIHYIKLPRRAQLNIQLDSFYLRIPHSQVKIRSITPKHSSSCHILSAILT